MNKSTVISLLKRMPNNEDNNYTIKLKEFVLKNDMINHQEILYSILNNNDNDQNLRFSAFYSLKIMYREYENYSKIIELVEKYGDEFTSIKLYNIVLSIYYRNKVILGEKEWAIYAIKYAENACKCCPNNLAIKHHYSEIIALMLEENITISHKEIDKAINRLDDVIGIYKKHAKYYCTKGRLVAAQGNYENAIRYINKALDLEVVNVNDKDAMIRIGKYNYYLLKIKILENNAILDKKIKNYDETINLSNKKIQNIIKNIDDMKTRYLEYLSFFASILTFIMITVNITMKIEDFNTAVGLLLIFAGILLITFILFRLLLPQSENDKLIMNKTILCLIIGIILIIFGIISGNKLSLPI